MHSLYEDNIHIFLHIGSILYHTIQDAYLSERADLISSTRSSISSILAYTLFGFSSFRSFSSHFLSFLFDTTDRIFEDTIEVPIPTARRPVKSSIMLRNVSRLILSLRIKVLYPKFIPLIPLQWYWDLYTSFSLL